MCGIRSKLGKAINLNRQRRFLNQYAQFAENNLRSKIGKPIFESGVIQFLLRCAQQEN